MTLGNRIRNRRQELGLTQPELAEKTMTTQGYISRVERDQLSPKSSMLLVFASALSLPQKELLNLAEKKVS